MKSASIIIIGIIINQYAYSQNFYINTVPYSQPIKHNEEKSFNVEIVADSTFNYSIFFNLFSTYNYKEFSYYFTINPVNPPYTSGTELKTFLDQYVPIGSRSNFMVEASAGSIQVYDSCYLYVEEAPDWINYYKNNSGLLNNKINVIENDRHNNKWIGTNGNGLAKYDGFGWQYFDLSNEFVTCIAMDDSDKVWIGTEDGIFLVQNNNVSLISDDGWVHSLVIDSIGYLWAVFNDGIHKYDGITWTGGYAPPLHTPRKLIIDNHNMLWSTFISKGIGKFDGINWVIYNTSNSNIPSNNITSMVIYESDLWLGTYKKLVKFDNANFISYECPLDDWIETISVDSEFTFWLGTSMGIAKYDLINWTVYDTVNSPLNDNLVKHICNDEYHNTFIGTWNGLAVYNKLGLPNFVSNYGGKIPNSFIVYQNYPNPFNPITKIGYDVSEMGHVTLNIYDVLGNEIGALINKEKPAGSYEVEFDATGLPSGIYFYQLKAGNFVETKKMVLLR